MSLISLLRTAGALPLAQLNMRASGTAEEVRDQLEALLQEGLVTIDGRAVLPLTEDLPSSNAMVKLTTAGTRRAFR
jgi:hypothetical protein